MKNEINIWNADLVEGVHYVGKFYRNQHVKGVVCGEYQILGFVKIGGEQCAELINLELNEKATLPLDCIEVPQ